MTSRVEPVLGPSSAQAPYRWRRPSTLWGVLLMALVALATPLPSSAIEVSSLPSTRSIDLPVSQGRLIKFDKPVESVFIADPSIADLRVVAPDVVYVYGTKLGTTNLIAISADKTIQASIQFRVLMDSAAPNSAIEGTSTIEISFLGSRAVVSGHARDVPEALQGDDLGGSFTKPGQPPLNNATIAGSQQVNIRVRFAEISRNDLQTFGINWDILAGNFSFGMMNGNSVGSTGRGLSAGFNAGSVNAEVLIDALKSNGIMKILAEPNLTAKTGETASFLAGGEIPIPVPQDGDRVTIQYKQFGVSLEFTPTVLGRNRIGLRVKPEVSALSSAGAVKISGFEVPALTVRRADTTVEVGSGQTFAVAGLFQRNLTQAVEKFPVLGDLPVLGSLFTSTRYRRDETELVILITPFLVEPTSERNMATPLDRPQQAPPAVQDDQQPTRIKDRAPLPRATQQAAQQEETYEAPEPEAAPQEAAEPSPPPPKARRTQSQRSGMRY